MTNLQRTMKRIAWRVIRTKPFNKIRPRLCHIPVFHLEGKTKRSNSDFSAVVFAKKEVAEYFSKLSCAEEPEIKFLGKKTYHDISSIIEDLNPDLALVEANQSFSEFLFANKFFVLPVIKFTLDISDPWDLIYSRMHHGRRNDIRRLKKDRYTYEITTDFEKFRSFYYKMYVPPILKRHGKSAQIVSFSECEKLFRNGGLLLVKLDEKIISGAVYVPQGNELYIPIAGISDTDKYLTKGGYTALYFVILWAKQHGYTTIDYGSCEPFLKNGIFLYKKGWGMKIRPMKGRDAKILAIRFCNFTEGTADILLDNPFIFTDNENQKGLVLLDSYDEDLYKKYYIPGLSGLVVLGLRRNTHSVQSTRLRKLSLEGNSDQFSLPLSFLMKLASERGYDAYRLDFKTDFTKRSLKRKNVRGTMVIDGNKLKTIETCMRFRK